MNNEENKNILFYSIISSLLVLLIILGGNYIYTNNTINKVEVVEVNTENIGLETKIDTDTEKEVETEEQVKEIRNIALLGIDSEGDDLIGRADVIMILTLDNIHNKIKLSSIMRDSYVNIDGYGMDKINHAYAYGGAELALKTINENFNLNISEVMSVNFNSLVNIIDKIGGITINITDEEVPHISGVSSAGEQLLSGSQALSYSRIRYASGGDYKRTERQRIVINAVFDKLKNISFTEYPQLINEFLPYIQTNISKSTLLELGIEFGGLLSKGLEQERFPRDEQCEGKTINDVYYLTFDIDSVKTSMKDYIFNDK